MVRHYTIIITTKYIYKAKKAIKDTQRNCGSLNCNN